MISIRQQGALSNTSFGEGEEGAVRGLYIHCSERASTRSQMARKTLRAKATSCITCYWGPHRTQLTLCNMVECEVY